MTTLVPETKTHSIVVGAFLLTVVAALWLPVGAPGGTVEEWLIRERYLQGMSVFETGQHYLRPLVYLPYYVGFHLTPGSFLGLNLLQMAFIWAKGFVLYRLLRALSLGPSLSAAAALLFLLHPADDGQMTLRTLSIQGVAFLFLTAVYLLVRFAATNRPVVGLGMVASLSATLLIYEAPLPLALASPLLLWVSPGVAGRRRVVAAGVWLGTLFILAGRYLFLLTRNPATYQATVLASSGSSSSSGAVAEALPFLGLAYVRSLWTGWKLATQDFLSAPRMDALTALVIGGLAAGFVSYLAGKSGVEDRERQASFYVVIALVGLLVIGLGFAMYLPTNVRESTWRTLILSSLGGSLFLAAGLRLLTGWSRRRRFVYPLLVGMFVVVAFSHLLAQHRGFARTSANQQEIVEGIVAAAPRLHPRTRLLLIFDDTDRVVSYDAFAFSRYLRAALGTRYELPDLNVHVCYPSTERRGEQCELGPERVNVQHQDVGPVTGRLAWEAPYDAVVALHRDRDGEISMLEEIPDWYAFERAEGYDPLALVDSGGGFRSATGRWRVDFDEDQFIGAGWDIERVNPGGITYRFMSAPDGAIHLPLGPGDHQLRVRIANQITPELVDSLGLSVGGRRLQLEPVRPGEFEAEIPAGLIRADGDTTIVFHQAPRILEEVQATRGPLIGLAFDWVEVAPSGGAAANPPAG